MKRIAIFALMLLASSCIAIFAFMPLASSCAEPHRAQAAPSPGPWRTSRYDNYPPLPSKKNSSMDGQYIVVYRLNSATGFTGSYSVFFGTDAIKDGTSGECELVVKPIYPSDIASETRYHVHSDPYKWRLGYAEAIEKHCGWAPGTIRAAWFHALNMGGNRRPSHKQKATRCQLHADDDARFGYDAFHPPYLTSRSCNPGYVKSHNPVILFLDPPTSTLYECDWEGR